jgi:hypothetical protein
MRTSSALTVDGLDDDDDDEDDDGEEDDDDMEGGSGAGVSGVDRACTALARLDDGATGAGNRVIDTDGRDDDEDDDEESDNWMVGGSGAAAEGATDRVSSMVAGRDCDCDCCCG